MQEENGFQKNQFIEYYDVILEIKNVKHNILYTVVEADTEKRTIQDWPPILYGLNRRVETQSFRMSRKLYQEESDSG